MSYVAFFCWEPEMCWYNVMGHTSHQQTYLFIYLSSYYLPTLDYVLVYVNSEGDMSGKVENVKQIAANFAIPLWNSSRILRNKMQNYQSGYQVFSKKIRFAFMPAFSL
jgi:hypothetical protein